jgi:hypothetical protein
MYRISHPSINDFKDLGPAKAGTRLEIEFVWTQVCYSLHEGNRAVVMDGIGLRSAKLQSHEGNMKQTYQLFGINLGKTFSAFAFSGIITMTACTQTQTPTGPAPEQKKTQEGTGGDGLDLGSNGQAQTANNNQTAPVTTSAANTTPAAANNGSGTVPVISTGSSVGSTAGSNASGSGTVVIGGNSPTTGGNSATTGGNSATTGAVANNGIPVINSGRSENSAREAYKDVPADYTPAKIEEWVAKHKAAAGNGFKYVFIPNDVAKDKESANKVRVAVGKAWNHLSWLPKLSLPVEVSDGTGLVFALNAQEVWGAEADRNWGFVAACSRKANIQVSPAPVGDCAQFNAAQPVAAPRFVYNAVNGGPYANIHKTPANYSAFTRKYSQGKIFAVTTQKDAIVCGPRITAYRVVGLPGAPRPVYNTQAEALKLVEEGKGLIYSYSSDEFYGRDNESIQAAYRQTAPTDRNQRSTGALKAGPNDDSTAIASEWWIQMPNGFMYWSIHGEGSQERGKAEFPFAVDPANWKQNAVLATGRSCITCHIKGTQSVLTDPEFEGKGGWAGNADMALLNSFSVKRFTDSMDVLTKNLSDDTGKLNEQLASGSIEPIKHAIMLIEGPYRGNRNGGCTSFCNGKFGSRRKNMCESLPAR